jgi:hypothetical protein
LSLLQLLEIQWLANGYVARESALQNREPSSAQARDERGVDPAVHVDATDGVDLFMSSEAARR